MMTDYSTAIDQREFDRLDLVFMPNAYIDYRAMGGIDGRFPEVKAWLKDVLPTFPAYYHMVARHCITVTGDTAVSKSICFNPMVSNLPDRPAETRVFFCGLWYRDKHLRTAEGWRILERVEERCYVDNAPTHLRLEPA